MNRLNASARGDDVQAALHVVAPVGGRRVAIDDRRQAAGDRLDRRQRVVHLVTDDPDQALPCLPFLFAQRLAQIRQTFGAAGRPAGTGCAGSPAADTPQEAVLMTRGASPGQAIQQPNRGIAPAEQPLRRLVEQPRACVLTNFSSCCSSNVNTATSISAITLRSSVVASSASRRWCRASRPGCVHLDHHFAASGWPLRAPRARMEVALAERREQVRQGLQRQDHHARAARGEPEADGDDHDGQRPPTSACRRLSRENERDERPEEAPRPAPSEDAAVVAQARFAGRRHKEFRRGTWLRSGG